MNKITKKNVIDELVYRELTKLDEICNVLESLGIVKKPDWKEYLTESDAYSWMEANPTKAEKKKVLTALGYDVSKL